MKERSAVPLQRSSHQRGITLPEMMIAISISSLIMIGAAQTYPLLRQQVAFLSQSGRLDQVMRQVMFRIEKDLRRAGFCNGSNGSCKENAITIASKSGEPAGSCVIVAYDFNQNGKWEVPSHPTESEYFGYRLRRGALEGMRGVANCQESGWGKLLDPQEIVVTRFLVVRQPGAARTGAAKKSVFRLQLAGHWAKHPKIHRQISLVFVGYNR